MGVSWCEKMKPGRWDTIGSKNVIVGWGMHHPHSTTRRKEMRRVLKIFRLKPVIFLIRILYIDRLKPWKFFYSS